jgi:hypothetical protein
LNNKGILHVLMNEAHDLEAFLFKN